MNLLIDQFIDESKLWKQELKLLRTIVQIDELEETVKWNAPCYTYNGKNIFLLGNYNNFCCISFLKGALLKDPYHLLEAPGAHSNYVRMFKFTNEQQIESNTAIILAYIKEAIELEQKGLKVIPKNTIEELPTELIEAFEASQELELAFNELTPGRQRAYLLFFKATKQSQTRSKRIEKYKDRILKGFGINDCVCGYSKRMPTCDGAHKVYNKK